MSDGEAIVYLEADDEVTSVVRRVRSADAARVIVVAPGRARAVSSVVALRLLGRAAAASDRTLAIVGDALTRSLAAEAGLETYATLEDARGSGRDPEAPAPRRATISVVRGDRTETTAPTLAGGALRPVAGTPTADSDAGSPSDPAEREPVEATASPHGDDEPTRAVPVAVPPAAVGDRDAARRHPSARPIVPVAVAALLAVLLAGTVAGAIVLPAATITIRPAAVQVGPTTYTVEDAPAERHGGTVEATATVTASGTYQELEPAAGTVVLFNWTSSPVRVPAGTFVAAGEQAFATQAEVVVPSGSLTADGRIAAGDVGVAVLAAAPGPAANVPAQAIDTVVNEAIDAQLRGFANNPERRVTNPEATSGGLDQSGPQIVQADVDAAIASLREQLTEARAAALPEADVVAVPDEAPEPVVEGAADLVGTRDEPEAAVEGSLAWEAWVVDAGAVEAEVRDRFAGDASIVPPGHELAGNATDLAIAATSVADGTVTVDVRVAGTAVPIIDRAAALEATRGRSESDAEAALASLGEADVSVWPFWVRTVPELDWRISVEIDAATESPGPSPRADGSSRPGDSP